MEIALISLSLIRKICKDIEKGIHLNILISNCFILCLFFCMKESFINSHLPHICLFKYFLGIPCPGCGILSSFFAFAKFNIKASFNYNSAGPLLFLFLVGQIPLRILALRDAELRNKISYISKKLSNILILALATVWIAKMIII